MAMPDVEKALRTRFRLFGTELVERTSPAQKDLDLCNGVATQDESTNTCALCVAVNHTVYRNPNKCDFWHFNCKCHYSFYNGELRTDFPMEKITRYLFVNTDKTKMMHKMGYYIEDFQTIYDTINSQVLRTYNAGNYILKELNIHGQHGEIQIIVRGKRDHANEFFTCHAGCVFYPFGKIKIVSPLILED